MDESSPKLLLLLAYLIAVFLAVCILSLFAMKGYVAWQQLLRDFARYLGQRGWSPTRTIPERACTVPDEGIMEVPRLHVYDCTHEYGTEAATIHLGISTGSKKLRGRTLLIASGDVRAPAQCLIGRKLRPKPLFSQKTDLPVSVEGVELWIRFCGRPHPHDREIIDTLDAVQVLFSGASRGIFAHPTPRLERIFVPGVVALLGPHGLIIRGPLLRRRRGAWTVEPFIASAERVAQNIEKCTSRSASEGSEVGSTA